MRRKKMLVGLLISGLLFAACGDDDDQEAVTNLGGESSETTVSSTTGTTAGGEGGCHVEDGVEEKGTEQALTMTEFKFDVAATETPVPAGIVTFVAENGGEDEHELVIVKGDDAASLPTNAETGEMDEAALPEGALIGEIEPFASGETCEGNFELEAGKYILLCNVTETEENGENESHFKEGMHVPFEVA